MESKKFSSMIIIALFFLFIVPLKVDAADCSYKEINQLQELAGKIKASYDNYDTNNFELIFKDVDSKFYLKDTDSGFILSSDQTGSIKTISTKGYTGGKSYSFAVYPLDGTTCEGEKVRTVYITLPKYNFYAGTETCQNYPEFSLCKKWLDTSSISEETFHKRLDEYKAELEKKSGKEDNSSKKSNGILAFLSHYYVIILLGVILIGGTVVLIFKYQEKKAYERGDKL